MNDIVLPSPAEIQSSIVNLGIMCLALFLLPMLYVLVWKKRCGRAVSLKPMVIGAVGFLVTVRVLELGVHLVCIIQDNPVSRFINGHTWAYVLYGASMAGIFEECGRYVILRFLMKRNKSRENYVMYGIGHAELCPEHGGRGSWLHPHDSGPVCVRAGVCHVRPHRLHGDCGLWGGDPAETVSAGRGSGPCPAGCFPRPVPAGRGEHGSHRDLGVRLRGRGYGSECVPVSEVPAKGSLLMAALP